MHMIIGIVIAFFLGSAAGFALMFVVAKEMVSKVRLQEEERHQKLMTHMDDVAGAWMDIVLDIQREVQLGHMQNKSIKDQLMVIKACISKANDDEDDLGEIEVIEDSDGSDRGES